MGIVPSMRASLALARSLSAIQPSTPRAAQTSQKPAAHRVPAPAGPGPHGLRLWSVTLASRDAGGPHIELIACVQAHPHADWLDFRITVLGTAIKVDQESLPSFQEAGDLAIARLVGVTVSRDVDAVDAFRTSAASIQVILPGNRTPVAMEGSWYAIGCQCWRCCCSNDKRKKKTFHSHSSSECR